MEDLTVRKLHLITGTLNISLLFSEGEIGLTVHTVCSDREPHIQFVVQICYDTVAQIAHSILLQTSGKP